MKKNTISFIFFYQLLTIGLFLNLVSCKKEMQDNAKPLEGAAQLVFTVKGMNNELPKTSNKLSKASNLETENLQNKSINYDPLSKKVDLISQAIRQPREANYSFSNDPIKNKNLSKVAAAIPVDHDVRYRLLLFDSQTDNLVANVDAKVNQNISINVTPGKSYYWRAYTHNSKEEMAPLDIETNGFEIETAIDKDMLWDESTNPITATVAADSIGIIFDYKVAEFIVNIDPTDLYGYFTELSIEIAEANYFNTGKLNLKTGNISNVTPATPASLSLSNFKTIPETKLLQAKFYTVDPSAMTNFVINVKQMSVRQDGASADNQLHKTTDPIKPVAFSFTNPDINKSHVVNMAFRYKIPTKTILHVTGIGNNDDQKFSFTAQPAVRDLSGTWSADPSQNRPPFNMIKTARNYGILSNSLVYTDGFEHRRCLDDGSLDQKLFPTTGSKPDIVIMTLYYTLDQNDISELVRYVNQGGVLIMMTDGVFPAEVTNTQTFFRQLFNKNDIEVMTQAGYNGGTIFRLDPTVNDLIMNGKFGNLGGLFWGVDTHNVVTVDALPIGSGPDQVTLLSETETLNRSPNQTFGANMFRHNSKNIFWIGNGSFLSTPPNESLNIRETSTAEPFGIVVENNPLYENYIPELNYNYYPMPKRYGVELASASLGYNFGTMVYNAPLFANLMHCCLYRAEFFGINPQTP